MNIVLNFIKFIIFQHFSQFFSHLKSYTMFTKGQPISPRLQRCNLGWCEIRARHEIFGKVRLLKNSF
ncbi:MAG: hypothetical protein A2X81_13630 [Desulfobacterales bacterium GWB2_56_26]|nr:MAG: hypothetical protein A2X81_13630 [Desulfobacterales bacterium GWB2_56_26]